MVCCQTLGVHQFAVLRSHTSHKTATQSASDAKFPFADDPGVIAWGSNRTTV